MNLRELLNESCISLDLPLDSKEAVFRTLSQDLNRAGIVKDPDRFRKAVEYRETLSETGLEEGIAIPHGIDATVSKAAIAYVRLAVPIEWESMDGKPVRHVFLLAIPENGDKVHIRMLSELAMHLIRKETRDALNCIKKKEELYGIL